MQHSIPSPLKHDPVTAARKDRHAMCRAPRHPSRGIPRHRRYGCIYRHAKTHRREDYRGQIGDYRRSLSEGARSWFRLPGLGALQRC